MCDVLSTTAEQPSGLRCKDRIKPGGGHVSWERVPSVGLDLASQTNKRDFFSYGLKATTTVRPDRNVKKLLREQLIRLCFGGDRH